MDIWRAALGIIIYALCTTILQVFDMLICDCKLICHCNIEWLISICANGSRDGILTNTLKVRYVPAVGLYCSIFLQDFNNS
jgi:hypothetical protein